MAKFADILKMLRIENGLTQQELADALHYTKSRISMYERGEREPNLDVMETIADYFNVDLDFLYGRSEIRNKYQLSNVSGISAPPETIKKPRLGAIACGQPILAEEHISEYDDVPVTIRCDFTLLCVGDSMTGAGIQDGDVVYIRQQPIVNNGDIAAVLIDGEATLKRFRRVGDTVMLLAENPNFEPMIYNNGEINGIQIIGKAVGFTREFKK